MFRFLLSIFLTVAATIGIGASAIATDLRIGFTVDALTLDPGNHRNRDNETLLRNMYDGLLTYDSNMRLVPELASSIERVDPLTYRLTLRHGVRFHDGSLMMADDVVFTFRRILERGAIDGLSSPRRDLLGPLEEVVAQDDHIVLFKLREPWPILPAMLPFQEIVSRSFIDRVGNRGIATQANGTGPFRLRHWRRGDALVLERFDGYYGGATDVPPVGPACVDRVIFRIIPESASRVAALLGGSVDIINELPPFAMRRVAEHPRTRVMKVNSTNTLYVALDNSVPPFSDVRVRRAANHALNKPLIIDRVLLGAAEPLNGVLTPAAFSFASDLPEYAFDPAASARLLAQAGYPNGVDVTLDTDGASKEMAEIVATMLTAAGIRTHLSVGEGSTLRSNWAPGGTPTGQMYLSSWGNATLDPSDIMFPTLHAKGRGNRARYRNAEVDALLETASVESDRARRAALYRKAQHLIHADAPWIFLWVPQDIYGVANHVTGFKPSPDSRIHLHDVCISDVVSRE